jgi:CRISPR-associated endoribonuclease Cas6
MGKVQKFTFHLIPKNPEESRRRVPAYIFRAVLMGMLGKIDSKYIEELHKPNQIRPYAISIKNDAQEIRFELIILTEEFSKAIMDYILTLNEFAVNINQNEYILLKIDLETIKMETFIKQGQKISKFNLRFLTPTYFNIVGRDFDMRLPEPTFLFENIAHIWNQFAPGGSGIDFSGLYEWISKNVFISSYQLKTRAFPIGKETPVIGCTGWATYLVKDPENGYAIWLDALLRFAEYSNLGGNRTAACGVIRYEPLEVVKS